VANSHPQELPASHSHLEIEAQWLEDSFEVNVRQKKGARAREQKSRAVLKDVE
jgi:hypothetical protein